MGKSKASIRFNTHANAKVNAVAHLCLLSLTKDQKSWHHSV